MYIIAGLGNPTKEYEGTRHNVGFDVIDRLSERYNIDVTMEKHRALIGKGMIAASICRNGRGTELQYDRWKNQQSATEKGESRSTKEEEICPFAFV